MFTCIFAHRNSDSQEKKNVTPGSVEVTEKREYQVKDIENKQETKSYAVEDKDDFKESMISRKKEKEQKQNSKVVLIETNKTGTEAKTGEFDKKDPQTVSSNAETEMGAVKPEDNKDTYTGTSPNEIEPSRTKADVVDNDAKTDVKDSDKDVVANTNNGDKDANTDTKIVDKFAEDNKEATETKKASNHFRQEDDIARF